MTEVTNDITKLPKWAQRELDVQRREIDTLRAELRRRTENQPSDVWIDDWRRGEHEYLALGAQVKFRLDGVGDSGRLQATVSVRVVNGHLHVMADGHPWGLAVKPQSGNVVNIAVVDS